MPIDQFNLIIQMCARIAVMIIIAVGAVKLSRQLEKPRGTYGAGLPERRRRERLVLRDPATLRPRDTASGVTA